MLVGGEKLEGEGSSDPEPRIGCAAGRPATRRGGGSPANEPGSMEHILPSLGMGGFFSHHSFANASWSY